MPILEFYSGFIPEETFPAPVFPDKPPYLMFSTQVPPILVRNPTIGHSSKMGSRPTLCFPINKTCLKSSIHAEDPTLVCTHCYGKHGGKLNKPWSTKAREKNFKEYMEDPDWFFDDLSNQIMAFRYFRYFVVGDLKD